MFHNFFVNGDDVYKFSGVKIKIDEICSYYKISIIIHRQFLLINFFLIFKSWFINSVNGSHMSVLIYKMCHFKGIISHSSKYCKS